MAYQFDPNDETTNVSDHIILVENETICKRIGDLGMKILQIMEMFRLWLSSSVKSEFKTTCRAGFSFLSCNGGKN